jgi:hypothetical protein
VPALEILSGDNNTHALQYLNSIEVFDSQSWASDVNSLDSSSSESSEWDNEKDIITVSDPEVADG